MVSEGSRVAGKIWLLGFSRSSQLTELPKILATEQHRKILSELSICSRLFVTPKSDMKDLNSDHHKFEDSVESDKK